MTNNSLDNLKIANKEKSLVNLVNKSNSHSELNSLSTNNQIRELLSIEQLMTVSSPLNSQLNIDTNSSSPCDLVAKIKSNEQFLTNLYNLSLSAKELVKIKQLITGNEFYLILKTKKLFS